MDNILSGSIALGFLSCHGPVMWTDTGDPTVHGPKHLTLLSTLSRVTNGTQKRDFKFAGDASVLGSVKPDMFNYRRLELTGDGSCVSWIRQEQYFGPLIHTGPVL